MSGDCKVCGLHPINGDTCDCEDLMATTKDAFYFFGVDLLQWYSPKLPVDQDSLERFVDEWIDENFEGDDDHSED